MPIQTDIAGKWNYVSAENFDEYMKEVGIGWAVRTIANKTKPTLEFTVSGDDWTMNSNSTFKNYTLKWTIGKQFDEKTADGRDVSNLFTIENDRLVQIETGKNGGKDSRIERYIENGKLYIVCTSSNVKCTRIYAKA
uniref:Lipocln_cytosolic_FA-bd_dom domain-containing protein n=1 Tax=Caenorhabditis japonica TaxID=281687 RepID=A0A8R1I1V2_CAEJA